MPLPVGHSLMGYVLHETLPQEKKILSWRTLVMFVVLANLPDIDFLPGFLLGNPNLYHRHFLSHSLVMSFVAGFAAALLFCWYKRDQFWTFFWLFTAAYASHVFLDLFSYDTSYPVGVPMFWPLTSEYVASPVPIFMAIKKSSQSANFFQQLFIWHNVLAAIWEFIVFVPVVSIIKLMKSRKRVYQPIYEE